MDPELIKKNDAPASGGGGADTRGGSNEGLGAGAPCSTPKEMADGGSS